MVSPPSWLSVLTLSAVLNGQSGVSARGTVAKVVHVVCMPKFIRSFQCKASSRPLSVLMPPVGAKTVKPTSLKRLAVKLIPFDEIGVVP